jgi:hypothetical protein
MRRLLCNAFGHRRDGKRARPAVGGWRAPCLNCGAGLVRVAPGKWREGEGLVFPHSYEAAPQPFSQSSQ